MEEKVLNYLIESNELEKPNWMSEDIFKVWAIVILGSNRSEQTRAIELLKTGS